MHNNVTIKTIAALAIVTFTVAIIIYEGLVRLNAFLRHEFLALRNSLE